MQDDEIRLYVARTTSVDAIVAGTYVTEEEQEWLRTFRFDRDRHEHLVSRALVRACLARQVGAPPKSLRFRIGQWGKPSLDPEREISFNASNHRDVVVCAVTRRGELGVDVEPISRSDEILEVTNTVFSSKELAGFAALPLDRRRDRAVTLWTVKEAYIKALGLGMSAPLREMTIDVDAEPPAVDGEPGWFLDWLDRHDARIAIAFRGPRTRPRIVVEDGEALIAAGS